MKTDGSEADLSSASERDSLALLDGPESLLCVQSLIGTGVESEDIAEHAVKIL